MAADKQEFEEAKFAAQLDQQQTQRILDQQMAIVDALNKQADTLKTLKEAIGADTIIGPTNTEAYKDQADIVLDAQETQQ